MGYESLKQELLEWLIKLDNDETINYLKIVKDPNSKKYDWWDDLTSEQKNGIERGLRDINQNRTISHDQVKKRYGI
ncbi:MAG: hypothetical protein JXR58_00725 [Bacteroidales bacterium]|nr:hypothetical protein [Bacteroidales bacterium]